MNDKDYIKDKFAEKLGNYQPSVRPELWASISSEVASVTGTATTGLSILTKTLIGISAAAIVTVSTLLIMNGLKEEKPIEEQKIVQNDKEEVNDIVSSVEKETLNKSIEEQQEEIQNESADISIIEPSVEEVEDFYPVIESENADIFEDPVEESIIDESENIEVVSNAEISSEEVENSLPTSVTELATNDKQPELVEQPQLFNFFSPNNDGDNDELYVDFSSEVSDFTIVILNQSNKVVFTSSDPNFKWKGKDLNGMNAENGEYVYFITYKDANGEFMKQSSHLTIRR